MVVNKCYFNENNCDTLIYTYTNTNQNTRVKSFDVILDVSKDKTLNGYIF